MTGRLDESRAPTSRLTAFFSPLVRASLRGAVQVAAGDVVRAALDRLRGHGQGAARVRNSRRSAPLRATMPPIRSLSAQCRVALEVIASMSTREVPLSELELRMEQRGCDALAVAQALAALERRGWGSRIGGRLDVTDAGYAAAMEAMKPRTAKKASSRKTRSRLPRGLFS
jgi:hypothetical protein